MTGRADFSIRVTDNSVENSVENSNTGINEKDTGYKDIISVSMEITGAMADRESIEDIVLSTVESINSCIIAKRFEMENDKNMDFKVQTRQEYEEMLENGYKENFENGEVLSL